MFGHHDFRKILVMCFLVISREPHVHVFVQTRSQQKETCIHFLLTNMAGIAPNIGFD